MRKLFEFILCIVIAIIFAVLVYATAEREYRIVSFGQNYCKYNNSPITNKTIEVITNG